MCKEFNIGLYTNDAPKKIKQDRQVGSPCQAEINVGGNPKAHLKQNFLQFLGSRII